MKVAIIGSGNVGKALARSGVKAGHEVTLSATSPEKAAESAKETGAKAAGSNQEAVKGADLVIVAVPYDKLGEVFRGLGTAVDGKIVVDATNHINTQNPERFSTASPTPRRSRIVTPTCVSSRRSTTRSPRVWPSRRSV